VSISDLPAVNASLNAVSTMFIVMGLVFIKNERKLGHIASMVCALVSSTLFLAFYLTYHFNTVAVTRFTHPGWPRGVYFFILFTHIPLAALVLPLVILTVIFALRSRYDLHRQLARITAPLWLYVSVTGVLVYLMLYVWFPPSRTY
jgi:uncharacterized membrane protein YozB (DUF420 family)